MFFDIRELPKPSPDSPPLPVMRRKGQWLIPLLAALIVLPGCAGFRQAVSSDTEQHTTTDHQNTPDTQARSSSQADSPDRPPEPVYRPIPAATLYSLLVAEMAGQRQRFDISLYNYMDQARTTRDPAIAERAARIAQYVGSDSHAIEAVAIWLAEDQDNPAAHQAAAQLLMEQNQFIRALEHLVILQDLAGISQFDYLAANAAELPEEQQTALLEQLQLLTQKYPGNASLWYACGIMEQHLRRYKQALNNIDKALQHNPAYLSAILQKARILVLMQRSDDAIDWLEDAQDDHPDHKGIQVLHARILLEQRKMDSARDAFAALHKRFPEDSAILLSLALLEEELGQRERAREYLYQLLASQSHTNEAHFYLGKIAQDENDYEAAIEQYAQVSNGREFLAAHLKASYLLNETQGIDAARHYLNDLRADYPQHSSELVRIEVDLLSTAGQPENAMTLISQALSVAPDDINLLYTRAMLAERLDDLNTLEQDLRTVIRLRPDHAEALNALGYTLADRTDRWAEALPLIERALQLTPDNPAVIDSLGWVYFRMGNLERARPLLKKAFDMMKDHEIAAHYGELLWLSGDLNEARDIWQQGLEQTPDSEIILRTLQRLNIDPETLSQH
ncbi:MAG: tetratricopeptide repeat protein [Saccharospirillaceae bacterium]|nr:tetratricopeptide repeat protein [Saccharospirillaceae bacterium]MCD8530076.1 tetratricopeptide repeat protein [Saccharospirillaceae bacterium]